MGCASGLHLTAGLFLTWSRDAPQVVEPDFLEFDRAECRLRPHDSLRPSYIPHHRQFTL
jgi:hypothetical protein